MFSNFNARALEFDVNNALALAHASELAYAERVEAGTQALDVWGFKSFRFFDALGTQAMLFGRSDLQVLAFRGTQADKIEDIATDLRIRKIGGPLRGRVHRGFLMALLAVWDDYDTPEGKHKGIERSIKEMRAEFNGGNVPALFVTGHSLGAALATLATAFLVEEGRPVQGLYTFGCPRVGDQDFAGALESRMKRMYRLVNNNDIVTRVPPRSFGYDHAGDFWYLSEDGELKDDPNSWYLFLDRALGRLYDIGEVGTDGIKDHAINNSNGDGYIPAIRKNLSGG